MVARTYRRVRTLIVCLLVTALARTVVADPGPSVEFHIQGGEATTTLTEFSRQARLQLLFDYNMVKGHATKPLNGVFQPQVALRLLLEQTGLEFDFVNERTLTVTQKKSSSGADAAPAATSEPAAADGPSRLRKSRTTADNATEGILEEVVHVTGTYLHDVPLVGQEIITASRDDIGTTGAATVSDFLSTLPQTFGGGPNQDTFIGQEAMTNSGLGVGVNLRGLGARATLVLINGRRVASSGTEGEFVDVENIPLSAIERIDILPDSASATYGADAVGGVVNFVLRDRLNGAETIARGGSGTRGDLQEYLFSQTLGRTWDGGSGLISFEFYDRGALPAEHRAYAVSDLTRFGGGDFDTIYTNPGNIIVGNTTWAIPSGQNGTQLTAADLVAGSANRRSQYLDSQIIPNQQRWNLYLNGREAAGERVSLYTDVLLGHREASEIHSGLATAIAVPSSNPFYVNPTGGANPILVGYNFGKDLGPVDTQVGVDTLNATLGLDFDAGAGWTVSAYGSYTREKQNQLADNQVDFSVLNLALADSSAATTFNAFADGSYTSAATLNTIRTDYRFWIDSQLKTADLIAAGPLVDLPAGPLRLAVGTDYRKQLFSTASTAALPGGVYRSDLRGNVLSAFGELVTPIVSEKNPLAGVRKLELSAAGRYERYTTFGGSITPKFAIAWSPVKDLALRGTWSRAVRPPTLADLDSAHTQAATLFLPDPTVPGGRLPTLIWQGGNAGVQPERARSWTAGLDFTPSWLPGSAVGLTYFDTVFTDRIQSTMLMATMLIDPSYSAIVTHDPSAAQIANVCAHADYLQGTSSDCLAAPAAAIVDVRVRNLATLITNGIDFNARYEHPLPLGKIRLGVSGTWLLQFLEAQTPEQPLTSLLNTQNEPVNLRLRGSATWELGGFAALIAANFTNSYKDIASIPQRRVDSWTTIDVQLRYDVPEHLGAWLHGIRVELDARNVFNVDPPFLNNQIVAIGYDQENANPYGRLLSLMVRKSW